MTMKELLNEVLDSELDFFKQKYKIWKNPDFHKTWGRGTEYEKLLKTDEKGLKKEPGSDKGFKFIVDLKGNDVYVFSSELLHNPVIRKIFGTNFNPQYIATGSTDKNRKIKRSDLKLAYSKNIKKDKLDKILEIAKKGGLT